MNRQEREGRRKQLRAAYLTTTIKGMACTEICDLINYSDAEITDLRAEMGWLAEMVKGLVASMANVQQGARDMVKFSDDRALEFKHERDRYKAALEDIKGEIEQGRPEPLSYAHGRASEALAEAVRGGA